METNWINARLQIRSLREQSKISLEVIINVISGKQIKRNRHRFKSIQPFQKETFTGFLILHFSTEELDFQNFTFS